ncbi:MAG TPA: hypothetical protein VM240_13585 [Verrucomicrobiae bacterium]|nr:hypothetical protein [Verrucomicrobiae bacterium]
MPPPDLPMSEISLNQHVSLADLAAWPLTDDEVTFRLTRGATFDPGVEGVAVGLLRNSIRAGSSFHLKVAFRPIDEAGRPQGLLEGLLGVHLLLSASSVTIEGDSDDARRMLIERVWSYIKQNEGLVGDGKRQTVVFRDPDYSIPECLRESSSARFPYPNKFKTLLARMSRNLAWSAELSTLPAEESVATVLYEAALNAHEHARWDSDNGTLPPAIRGIVLEKLHFNSRDELQRRTTLSPGLREYIARAWSEGARQVSFLAATVTDAGIGIQHTLPPKGAESAWDRLNRAFKSGVTRKPIVPDKGLGEGLPSIAEAALRLRAYLSVSSAELNGFRDFTLEPPGAQDEMLVRHPIDIPKRVGTSLTVIWPVLEGRGSQGRLFQA